MKYDVLVSFTDDNDKAARGRENIYWAGKSKYPRDGYMPSEARIAYLQSDKTSFGQPVISGEDAKPVKARKEKK